MVLNAVVQALKEAEELKLELNRDTDNVNRSLCLTQLQKTYQSILLMDLDFALDKKIEQDLWNIGFKSKIEFLQTCARDKKNSRRAENQTLLSCALQSAMGFYICLLHQICTVFHLDLPFGYQQLNSLDNKINFPNVRMPQTSSCCYICQYCLVHLGDLARYNRQIQLADSYYRQALNVSPDNGQPYNQIGLLRAAHGDKLGAAYYHARGLAVGGPFQPALNNLIQTLSSTADLIKQNSTTHLTAKNYINNYMNIHYKLQSGNNLSSTKEQIAELNSTLIALVATDQFESDTLMKMICLDIYALHIIINANKDINLSENNEKVYFLTLELIVGSLASLLLPAYTRKPSETIFYSALPAIKLLFEWIKLHPDLLKNQIFISRPQLWPGLCTLLNNMQESLKNFDGEQYNIEPLPEDIELQGFLPINKAFSQLKCKNLSTFNNISEKSENHELLTDDEINANIMKTLQENYILKKKSSNEASDAIKNNDNFHNLLRAYRMVKLGEWLSTNYNYITIDENETKLFKPVQNVTECNKDVIKTIEEISLLREKHLTEENNKRLKQALPHEPDDDVDLSDSEISPKHINVQNFTQSEVAYPPPIVISEADYREKVKEKCVGILKPQGSLEKSREEKALSRSAAIEVVSPDLIKQLNENLDLCEVQDNASSSSTVSQEGAICTDIGSLLDPPIFNEQIYHKKEGKRVRTNIAMQAIMKKQELQESKQVKFVTPISTPDVTLESNQIEVEKNKLFQPKVMKNINILPSSKKTGGILSLKDKSAGYPHLVNVEQSMDSLKINLDDTNTKEEKCNIKATEIPDSGADYYTIQPIKANVSIPNASGGFTSFTENYVKWSDGKTTDITKNSKKDENKLINFNNSNVNSGCYSYFPQISNNTNISFLDVINPKEIDVRSAAMQKPKPNFMVYDNHPKTQYENYVNSNAWHYNLPRFPNLEDSKQNIGNISNNANIGMRSNFNVPKCFENNSQQHIWKNPESDNFLLNNTFTGNPVVGHQFHKNNYYNAHQQARESVQPIGTNNYNTQPNYNFAQPPNSYNQGSFARNTNYYNNSSLMNQIVENDKSLQMKEKTTGPFEGYRYDMSKNTYAHNFNADIPEFVPRQTFPNSENKSFNQLKEEANTYSLFNIPQSPWEDKKYNQNTKQSQWPKTGTTTTLEKLLEQQKQLK